MNRRIGAATDDFSLPVKAGLDCLARLGFGSVELGTSSPDVNPRALSRSGRRHLARHVGNLGLSLAALSGEPGGSGQIEPASLEARADHTRAVLEMAADLGAGIVTTGLGRLIHPSSGQPEDRVVEVLKYLGEQADRVGVLFAARVGDDDPVELATLLERMNCPSLRVCIDPAAVLGGGGDVTWAVGVLCNHLALAHARDATLSSPSGGMMETRLGRGDVDFISYLASMAAAGYTGPHIIRRTDTRNPVADLAESKAYLESMLNQPCIYSPFSILPTPRSPLGRR